MIRREDRGAARRQVAAQTAVCETAYADYDFDENLAAFQPPLRARSSLEPGQQRPGGDGDVPLAHQRFADEKRLDARSGKPLAIGVIGDAALRDDDLAGRDMRLQPFTNVERDFKRAKIAIVDADETALERERPLTLAFVVGLDQDVEPEIVRGLVEGLGRLVVDRRHDDEDAVRAPGARLEHLIGIEHEILAQDGKRGRLTRFDQVLWRTLKGGEVGQNRDAGGAARLVGLGERRGVEVVANQAFGRARLLNLGDEAEPPLLVRPLDRLDEAARRRLAGDLAFKRRARHPHLGVGDLPALVALDFLQDVGHRASLKLQALDTAMSRSRTRRAAPEPIAAIPAATPSLSEAALPATTRAAAALKSAMSR